MLLENMVISPRVHSVHKSLEISCVELHSAWHNGIQLLGFWRDDTTELAYISLFV